MAEVLIVEDEVLLTLLYTKIVKKEGHTVISVAHSAEETLTKINEKLPDVILLDIALEERNSGIKLCKIIKIRYPHIKIYFISSYPPDLFKEELERIQYDGYIDKIRFQEEIPHILNSN